MLRIFIYHIKSYSYPISVAGPKSTSVCRTRYVCKRIHIYLRLNKNCLDFHPHFVKLL